MVMARAFSAGALLALSARVAADCVFTQNCSSNLTPGCHPVMTTPENSTPMPMRLLNYTDAIVCPQYSEASCCSAGQNMDLNVNLFLMQLAFGSPSGCDACVANLKAFWCAFTCAPNQSDFVKAIGYAVMPDPDNNYKNMTVLQTAMTVDPHFACALFASCKGTPIAQSGGLTICEQFINFQAQQSAIGKGSYTDIVYATPEEDPNALSLPYYDCCSFPANFSDPAGGNISCPCATCAGMCGTEPCFTAGSSSNATSNNGLDTPAIGVMNGFYWPTVVGIYAALAAVSVAFIFFPSQWCGKGKRPGLPTSTTTIPATEDARGLVYSLPYKHPQAINHRAAYPQATNDEAAYAPLRELRE